MLYNNPKGLLDTVSKIMSESKTKFDNEQKKLDEAHRALWEKKMGKKPLHPNQQKLDVHEPEKDELTAKDFKMLRAGKKAKMEEGVKQVNELKASTLGNYIKKASVDAKYKGFQAGYTEGDEDARSKKYGSTGAGAEMDDKAHKRLAGVKKATDKLTAKAMKEAAELDEARGRPRKNPLPAGESQEEEPDQNIVNHLKKSIDSGGNHDVRFADKTTHKVPSLVAHTVLTAMGKLKPADRLEIQKHISQSRKNLMQVHGMIK